MKKIIVCLLLSICSCFLFAQTVYTVETSQGTQEVIIPDGSTEKDVLLAIATAYYELNWNFDKVSKEASDLVASVETYVKENQVLRTKYEDLASDYVLLSNKMNLLTKKDLLKGLIGCGISYGKSIYPIISIGVEIQEKVLVIGNINFIPDNLSFGAGVSILF